MYTHHVQYYETDKMGVTHHSNYIRFMEEARLEFFKNLGFDYLEFEKMGLVSPVIGLNNIRYKKPSTVGDDIDIYVSVLSYNSLILTMHYEMKIKDLVIFVGDSDHCFLSKEGKMLPLGEKNFPELHKKLKELAENHQ